MHLLPTFAIVGILVLAWKKPKIGGWVFVGLAVVFTIFFKHYNDPISFLLIEFPVILIGVMFLLNKYAKK